MITLGDDEARQLNVVVGGAIERPNIAEDLEMAVGELQTEWIPDEGAWPSLTTRGVHGRAADARPTSRCRRG